MRKPFALFLSVCIIISAFGSLLIPVLKLPFLIIVTVSTIILLISTRKRIFSHGLSHTTLIALCGIGGIIMLLTVYASDQRLDTYRKLARDGDEHTIRAVVVEVNYEESFASTYTVRFESLDGETASSKGLLFTDTNTGLSTGDLFECSVGFEPLGEVYSFYDIGEGEMAASGYDFACRAVGDIDYLGRYSSNIFVKAEVMLMRLRSRLAAALTVYLDRDTASLAAALLFGIRNEPELLARNFRIIGASHLLALSGLHITIVCGIFAFVLRSLRVPEKPRIVLIIAAVIGYLMLTGLPYSAIRASIMVIITQLAKLLRRDSNPINALLAAAMLILLFNPYAIYDMGFTLSFAATLGLIIMSSASLHEFFNRLFGKGKLTSFLSKLMSGIVMTLGAVMFLVPLQWLYFGEMSLLSPVSSLLLTPLVELMLWLLIPCLIFSLFNASLLAVRTGFLIELLYDLTDSLSSSLASSTKLISLKYPFVVPLILTCAGACIIMIYFSANHRLRLLIPFGAFMVLLFTGIGIYEHLRADDAVLTCFNHKSNEAFMLTLGDNGFIIDVSDGSKTALELAVAELSEHCVTEVDTIVLTHIHRRHLSSIRSICESRMVRRIIIPKPTDDNEVSIATDLAEVAEQFSVRLEYLPRPNEATLTLGDNHIVFSEKCYIARSTHQLIGIEFMLSNTDILYLGASTWENVDLVGFGENADIVIYGSHGPVIKNAPGFIFDNEPRIYSTSLPVSLSIGAELIDGNLTFYCEE